MRTFLFSLALILFLAAPARAGTLCMPSQASFDAPVFGLSVTGPYDKAFWLSVYELQVPWLRAEVRWDEIEKKKDSYDFAAFDNLLLDASTHHTKLLIVFDHPPAWATRKTDVFLKRLEAVTAAMALRSGGRVGAWEVFNEPNLPGHGWPFKGMKVRDNAKLYAAAVQAMSTGLRSRGFSGPIVAGAVSMQGQSPDEFLNDFVNGIPCACYDYISIHPHGKIGRLAETQKDFEQRLQKMANLPVKVWFTDVGHGDLKDQDKLLAQALAETKDVRALFWYTLRDTGDDFGYGLTTSGNLRKPTFDRLQAWLKKQLYPK